MPPAPQHQQALENQGSGGRDRDPPLGSGQLLFRTLNEQIRRLADDFAVEDVLELVCECADRECFARISVPPDEFEALRERPKHFLAKPGHIRSGETVVLERADYAVIEIRPIEHAHGELPPDHSHTSASSE